jgi:hypothetical protein
MSIMAHESTGGAGVIATVIMLGMGGMRVQFV